MKIVAFLLTAGLLLGITSCASTDPVTESEEACVRELRFAIEQNVESPSGQWLAYDMSADISLVETEEFEGGRAYTFEGLATLTAEDTPTETATFTCFSNNSEEAGKVNAAIITINGQCTKAREEKDFC
jgi:hypothetical protein